MLARPTLAAPTRPALTLARIWRSSSIRLAAAVALALLLLFVTETVRLVRADRVSLPIDDQRLGLVLLDGFHAIERDDRGPFRWTRGEARATLAMPWASEATDLRLVIGSAAPGRSTGDLSLDVGVGPPMVFGLAPDPRVYTVLVPHGAARLGNLELLLRAPAMSLAGDPREMALRVDGLALRSLSQQAWPAAAVLLLQGVILTAVGLIGLRVCLPDPAVAALVLIAAFALALAGFSYPLVMPSYLVRLAVAFGLLAALTYGVLPQIERRPSWLGPPAESRALWGVAILASGLRLAGTLYPPFVAYDLQLNIERLAATVGGILVATNESFEFAGGVTVYPSGPYLILMVGMLTGLSTKLALQGGIALVDGMATLGVAALGRALGLRPRAVLFASVAYAAVAINFATLYYGHTAQAFGQALMAPLAVALLVGMGGAGRVWSWLIAWVLMSAALLSHIGVTILALAWLGIAWLALTLRRTLSLDTWRCFSITLFAGGLMGLVFVYGPVVFTHLDAVSGLGGGAGGGRPAYNLIAKAIWLAYGQVGLLLAVAGLALLPWRCLPTGARELLGAWAGAVALFWGIEMLSGLQVRYLVFFVPLVCLLAGVTLAWLAERGRPGLWLARSLALVLVAQGVWVWFPGTFERIAPSMVMLLR